MVQRICRRLAVAVANRTTRKVKRQIYKSSSSAIRQKASCLGNELAEGFNGRIFVDSGSAGFKSFDIEIRRAAERIIGGSFVLFGEWFDLPRDITVEDEWRTDFVAGYRFPDGPYDAIKPESGVADIKVPWEYGRMQYLLPLAAAFRQTGDARFLDCYRAKVGSFASVNPMGRGVQWTCTMEVGIRVFNLLSSYELLRCGLCEDDPMHTVIAELAFCHGEHIWANLETSARLQENNHYIADLLGLAAVVAAYPNLPKARKWGEYTHNELMRCVRKQVLDDGCCFERSTRYTRLMGEMLFFAGVCFAEAPYKLPAEYFERLSILGRFLDAVTNKDGRSLQVGDNDSGRVVCISPERYDDLRLVSRLVDREIGPDAPDEAFFAEEELFYGASGRVACFPSWRGGARTFYDAGMALARYGDWSLGFFASDGFVDESEPGHTHNDKLSFTLGFKGVPFFVDPGSGVYTRDPKVRNILRGTAQHSTLRFGNLEQNEFRGLFGYTRCGGASLDVAEADGTVVFRGATDCWATRLGVTHKRVVEVGSEGVAVKDDVEGAAPAVAATRSFVLAPEVDVSVVGRKEAVLTCRGVSVVFCAESDISVREGLYSPHYGAVIKSSILDVPFEYGRTNVITVREILNED